jgi:hypothetical protein
MRVRTTPSRPGSAVTVAAGAIRFQNASAAGFSGRTVHDQAPAWVANSACAAVAPTPWRRAPAITKNSSTWATPVVVDRHQREAQRSVVGVEEQVGGVARLIGPRRQRRIDVARVGADRGRHQRAPLVHVELQEAIEPRLIVCDADQARHRR